MPETSRLIIVGGIYRRFDGGRYRVLGFVDDVTHYEQTGQVVSEGDVVYGQLYKGLYPKGHRWTRKRIDFLGQTQVDERIVNIFELESKPNLIDLSLMHIVNGLTNILLR